jgi:hypothetical protein
MPSARIIVCEKTGQWAIALRRLLAPGGHRVQETRSWPACWAELARHPASLLVVELTAQNAELVLERLTDLPRRFRHARAVVVGDRDLARYEWAVRSAGATHAVFTPRELPPAARLIARHLALAPQPELSLREAVWRRLPWRRKAEI